jgi:hypothetical protein
MLKNKHKQSKLPGKSLKKFNTQDFLSKYKYLLGFILVVLLVFGYLLRTQLIAATVNGAPVWRYTVVKELEQQAGQQALDSIIVKKLILDKAQKENIVVSNEEIDAQVAQIEQQFTSQGQDFEQLLSMQGTTRQALREQIRLQLILEKLVGGDVEASDEEINDFYEQNTMVYEGQELEDVKDDVKQQLNQQKSREKINTYLDDLKNEASINYFLNY